MSTNRLAVTALALWGATALAIAAAYVNHRRAVPVNGDTRTALALPAHAASAVRAEMRTMLGSLQEVLQALAAGDTARAREAALRSGTAMAVDPELERLLPEEFVQLGMRTHAGFDTVAGLVSAPRDTVLARLSGITANCVACHATFRMSGH